MPSAKRPRRSRTKLETAVARARGSRARADAHFQLAVFHDSHGREAAAIPHYRAALKFGLPMKTRAQALAWLASSYYKTGMLRAARRRRQDAENIAVDAALRRWLGKLTARVNQRLLTNLKKSP